jgi:hypothetical protein
MVMAGEGNTRVNTALVLTWVTGMGAPGVIDEIWLGYA